MAKAIEYDNQEVVLVKLGGSVITHKAGFKQANMPKIEQLVDEIGLLGEMIEKQ